LNNFTSSSTRVVDWSFNVVFFFSVIMTVLVVNYKNLMTCARNHGNTSGWSQNMTVRHHLNKS